MEQTGSTNPQESNAPEPGLLHIEEKEDEKPKKLTSVVTTEVKPVLTPQTLERTGTVEHLAARHPLPDIDVSIPDTKEHLAELRINITRLLTGLRWEDVSIETTAEQLIPLLNLGSPQQWHPVLIPFLLEIDRAGNLIPVWLHIIEKGDPPVVPPGFNPAESMEGCARRIAILMLGNYRAGTLSEQKKTKNGSVGFMQQADGENNIQAHDVIKILSELVKDPQSSLYATQALVKLGTNPAMQALISSLREVEGWAKVDVIESCLALEQARFYDILVASGLDHVSGLESYVAIPLYRSIPLEKYLSGDAHSSSRLAQQAALIFGQVLRDSTASATDTKILPPVFQHDLTTLAHTLFDGAQKAPTWQNVLAIHQLGLLLGHYWNAISQGSIQDARIIDPVYTCVPMMPEVERWMGGPGRDILLETLTSDDDQVFISVVRILGELREPRAISSLISRIEATQALNDRLHGRALSAACDALGLLGDRRATQPILQLVERIIDVERRTSYPKRRDNLPAGDADIPGSMVYAAVLRTCGQLKDRAALDSILSASDDFDPYVRTQAIEALKQVDAQGEDLRSRAAGRTALSDPRDTVIRAACQLVLQYHDSEAHAALEHLVEAHPELAATAYDIMRQLGH